MQNFLKRLSFLPSLTTKNGKAKTQTQNQPNFSKRKPQENQEQVDFARIGVWSVCVLSMKYEWIYLLSNVLYGNCNGMRFMHISQGAKEKAKVEW